jgi:hypothetical protein
MRSLVANMGRVIPRYMPNAGCLCRGGVYYDGWLGNNGWPLYHVSMPLWLSLRVVGTVTSDGEGAIGLVR